MTLKVVEHVLWSSPDKNSDKETLEREKIWTQSLGKTNIKVDFFIQYVHRHSLGITHMLKSGYSNDQQKLNRLQNSKITK